MSPWIDADRDNGVPGLLEDFGECRLLDGVDGESADGQPRSGMVLKASDPFGPYLAA